MATATSLVKTSKNSSGGCSTLKSKERSMLLARTAEEEEEREDLGEELEPGGQRKGFDTGGPYSSSDENVTRGT